MVPQFAPEKTPAEAKKRNRNGSPLGSCMFQGKLAGENFGGFRSVFVLCVVAFFCRAFKDKTHQTSQK